MRKRYLPLCLIILVSLASCGRDGNGSDRPIIGITCGTVQMKMKRFCIDVNQDSVEAVEDNGGRVIALTVKDPERALKEKLAMLDGVLIPGGLDVHPSRYGEEEDAMLEAVDPPLDRLELRVLEYARQKGLPVLGICRGCQILNVFYGGSLYQDIPTRFRGESTVSHRRRLDLIVYTHSLPCFHEVNVSAGTRLHSLLGRDEIRVNTYHHQAVKRLADGFIVNARSTDGLVEGIERPEESFVMGTQFHPEKMRDEAPIWNRLFEEFIRAARGSSGKKTLKEKEIITEERRAS